MRLLTDLYKNPPSRSPELAGMPKLAAASVLTWLILSLTNGTPSAPRPTSGISSAACRLKVLLIYHAKRLSTLLFRTLAASVFFDVICLPMQMDTASPASLIALSFSSTL